MYEEFVKEYKIKDKTEEQCDFELIQSILHTKLALEQVNKNFEFAEAELIDYYTYEIKANQAKLDYLLKKAKHRGIILDMVNQILIKTYDENEVG